MTGEGLDWNEITVPVDLPEVVDHISYQRVVENAGATWDYFPGHFDPDYAQSQGNPTIYVNTMHLAGFADRVATDWAGPSSRVVRRSMRLAGSVYAGDTDTSSSTTVSRSPSTMGRRNSTSLAALMNVVPGNGTRSTTDAAGGLALPCWRGSHGGGISHPINKAGGASSPPHLSWANSASQYERFPSWTIAANNRIRAPLTGVAAVRGSLFAPTMRSASS